MSENPANYVSIEGNKIAVSIKHDPDLITSVRLLSKQYDAPFSVGALWKCTLPLTAKDDVARLFYSLQWSPLFRKLSKNSAARLQTAENILSTKLLATIDLNAPLPDGRKLYEHQITGIEWLARTPRGILADDFGLGKTLQSLLTARMIYETTRAHTVVITKASLISDWRKEAAKLNHRVVSCYSWAKIPKPSPGQHYVLIADEAHFAQSTETKRGKSFLEWADASDFVFMLTGTPMMNGRHLNLFPLLMALRHPLARNRKEYEKMFCGAPRVVLDRRFHIDDEKFTISFHCKVCNHANLLRWNWTWKSYNCAACNEKHAAPKSFIEKNGAKNAPELRRQLAPFILRRLKSECLDLPPKTRVVREIEISAEMQAQYDAAFSKAKQRYNERVASGVIAKAGEALAILNIVRMAASLAKVPAAIELAEEALEEGLQPICFFEFVESVKAFAKHFEIPPYYGDTKVDQKVRIVEDFQAGRQKVFSGSREAGGTGLTLTAGNVVIMGDRPLRPGDASQAEDRAHRIGTFWPVTCCWIRAFPVCEKIDGMLATKQKAITALLGSAEEIESENANAQTVLADLFTEKRKEHEP